MRWKSIGCVWGVWIRIRWIRDISTRIRNPGDECAGVDLRLATVRILTCNHIDSYPKGVILSRYQVSRRLFLISLRSNQYEKSLPGAYLAELKRPSYNLIALESWIIIYLFAVEGGWQPREGKTIPWANDISFKKKYFVYKLSQGKGTSNIVPTLLAKILYKFLILWHTVIITLKSHQTIKKSLAMLLCEKYGILFK